MERDPDAPSKGTDSLADLILDPMARPGYL
ncbi:hypothetical protein AGR6A_Lc90353 [Agrobacterium sp. NCPPB 925]|nr:hypothetical protein AGR6A_Lc90353 [Agrobacterium sp. NCPPB 925]